ncbi:MAG: hypothetical protein GEV10_24920 [Streptosporangiales bacterium]|nr:hypothetical protein [Streptosporangiales bacterium]
MSRGLVDVGESRQSAVGVLPALPAVRDLLPDGGLRRGSVATVDDPALMLALAAGPSATGGWVAVVGMPDCGVLSAVEMGVDPHRLLLVDRPGPRWAEVVAALLDGIDLVLTGLADQPAPHVARRLTALARRHGSALVVAGPWQGADLHLRVSTARWTGVADGHGHLGGRYAEVTAQGRRGAVRPRTLRLWLPAADGGVRPAGEAAGDRRPEPAREEAIA